MAQQRGLGKGIGALFADYTDNREVNIEGEGAIQQLDITMLDRNPEQARKTFDEETLKEMSNSMKLYGVLQPLLVTKLPNGRYQIVAGERRYRAAMKANLKTVPAIIKDLPVEEIKAISLIENIQREDLNAIEAAEGIKELMTNHGLTQEAVADRIGKSRPYVTNLLRLLTLPEEVLEMVKNGKISSGHARALVTIDNKEFLINLAKQIVQYKMTVRDVEDRVRLYETRKNIPSGPRKTQPLTLELKELVSDMKRVFGTRVKLVGTPEKGRFSIDYFSKDDLERIYQLVEILKKDNN